MNEVDELKIRGQLERQLARGEWKGLPIPEQSMALIREFDRYNKAREVALSTRLHYVKGVKAAAAMLGKALKEASKQDMVEFVANFAEGRKLKTVNNVKIATKRFYQWLYKMEDDEYPEVVKWMKPKPAKNMIQPEQLLIKEEKEKALASCRNQRDRAIIMALDERGPRPHELLGMKVGDVVINKYGVRIMVDGKTGARPLPFIDAAPDIQLWLNQHPARDDPSAPLWTNMQGGRIEPLTYDGLRSVLRRVKKRAGLKRRVWAYLFRHTALTKTSTQVPESVLRKVAGWVPGSRMPEVYVHLAGADAEKALLKARGIEVEGVEEEGVRAASCPRCQALNPPGAKFCAHCSMALSAEAAMELMDQVEEAKTMKQKLDDLSKKYEALTEALQLLENPQEPWQRYSHAARRKNGMEQNSQ